MGIDLPTELPNESAFQAGMLADAKELGDAGTIDREGTYVPSWDDPFIGDAIDGVLVVAGDCRPNVDAQLDRALHVLRHSVRKVVNLVGHVRPGEHEGKEHFGFQDGISNPTVTGFGTDLSELGTIKPGIILCGKDDGDPNQASRPGWAIDGSFLAFRLLKQLVPEFNSFILANATPPPTTLPAPLPIDPTHPGAQDAASTLLAARMTGRWPSGAPLQLSPFADDPALGADPALNNAFTTHDVGSQTKCPFAAHTRKMNPRGDLATEVVNPHRVMRRGMQYGPEVTEKEEKEGRTVEDRGLLFVCYQSSLEGGFRFLQNQWANNTQFPPTSPPPDQSPPIIPTPSVIPGQDPLIGQVVDPDNVGPRAMTGADPSDPAKTLDLGSQTWVEAKGGEYLFSPSIAALRDFLATAVHIFEGEGQAEGQAVEL